MLTLRVMIRATAFPWTHDTKLRPREVNASEGIPVRACRLYVSTCQRFTPSYRFAAAALLLLLPCCSRSLAIFFASSVFRTTTCVASSMDFLNSADVALFLKAPSVLRNWKCSPISVPI